MLLILSIIVLAYMIKGKDTSALVRRIKESELRANIVKLLDKLRPWALKIGRTAARPLVAFYYVLSDEGTPLLDKVLIYAAILYVISPLDLLPRAVYSLLGILDDGVAVAFVYKRIKSRMTPHIKARVEDTLNEWFGIDYKEVEA